MTERVLTSRVEADRSGVVTVLVTDADERTGRQMTWKRLDSADAYYTRSRTPAAVAAYELGEVFARMGASR